MKTIKFISILLAAAIMAISCNKKNPDPASVTISASQVTIDATTPAFITYTATNAVGEVKVVHTNSNIDKVITNNEYDIATKTGKITFSTTQTEASSVVAELNFCDDNSWFQSSNVNVTINKK